MTSLELLNQLENITLSIIKDTEAVFLNLEEEIINTNVTLRSWSVAQCLNHLNHYSVHYHPKLIDVFEKSKAENGLHDSKEIKYTWLGKSFLKYIKLDENNKPKKKIKAPKGTFQVNSDFTMKEVQVFLENQKELLKIIQKAKQVNFFRFKVVTMLPFLKLKIIDALSILVYHNQRHIVQAKNVLIQITANKN